MAKTEALAIVDWLFEDMDEQVMLGSALYCLSPAQRERLRQRWAEIIAKMATEPA